MQAQIVTGTFPLPGLEHPPEAIDFAPTRAAGRARLDQFVSRSGQSYARLRNYDYGPAQRSNVSALSPWIRHRLLTEEDVLRSVLARHSPSGAEKFIQEVFWRSYFKGWLEQRPSVWGAYQASVTRSLNQLDKDSPLATDYEAAIAGRVGIDGFDQWARELVATGYLHNHARMWFTSIWIFTLRLPWELGADFFLRHLLDGDPASNTLSWRWVAGLHTKGKAYKARISNIAKYTDGRFRPHQRLADDIEPLSEAQTHVQRPIPSADPCPYKDFLLLITEEDCSIKDQLSRAPSGVLGLVATKGRSPLDVSALTRSFAQGAVADAMDPATGPIGAEIPSDNWAERIIAAAETAQTSTVVTGYAPVGPVATELRLANDALRRAGIEIRQIRRGHDDLVWPHATKGFFALKQKIPRILGELGLSNEHASRPGRNGAR